MAAYDLSEAADEDLAGIAEFTLIHFGVQQSYEYSTRLEACFQGLADNPQMGLAVAELAPGLRRFVLESHVIYYRAQDGGVLIVRVLHSSRDVRPEVFKTGER